MSVNVLITGATGFIGQNLISSLPSDKYKKSALMRYIAGRYVLGEDINKYYASLNDYFSIRKIIKELQPEIVVHLAALSAVSYSYDHPQEVIDTNFLGSVNLAESCLRDNPNLKKFIFASTSETYGNHPDIDLPLHEASEQYPNSPYSASKKATEDYLRYMFMAYGFPVVIARPFNTYGRKHDNHFMIERAITQMIKNPKGDIYLGDPDPIRDWMYVDDHVNAYKKIIESDKQCIFGDAFNFCTGSSYTIAETVQMISQVTGFYGNIHWNTIPKRPLDINVLKGINRKSKTILGWEPTIRLKEGLRMTTDYWSVKQ